MIAVIDTSALMRFYIPDGDMPEGFELFLREIERGNNSLLAPELILAEAGQVIHKKRTQKLLSEEEAIEILKCILELPIKLFSHKDFLEPAFYLSKKYNLSVYDSLFLSIAEHHSAKLITVDKKLQTAAKKLSLL